MVLSIFQRLWTAPRRAAIGIIRLYQQTLSPDHGPLKSLWTYGYCRHSPTCSMYATEVIARCGLIIGSLLSFRRLLTCHPWRKIDDAKYRELTAKALDAHASGRL